jgi:predicted transcriptional regulator
MESMESKKTDAGKIEDKKLKEIAEPATAVSSDVSVKVALDEIKAQGGQSSPVTDQGGKLLGSVSKDQMNRKVGGCGHDPQTAPVEPQVEKESAYCFEDQTVGEAEKVMRDANVDELSVVSRDKVLIGKTNLGAISHQKKVGEEKTKATPPARE